MPTEPTLAPALPPTEAAPPNFLVRMSGEMHSSILGARELSSANVTGESCRSSALFLSDVLLQIVGGAVFRLALVTAVRLSIVLTPHMRHHVALGGRRPLAVRTHAAIRLLSRVHPCVSIKRTDSCARVVVVHATKRFLTDMNCHHVCFHVDFAPVGFPKHCADPSPEPI